MIYTRKNKYEVIRIDKILYPVSVAYMSIPPPHHATRPIGGTAQLLGSPGTVRSDARAREWTGFSNSASRMVRSALDLSNSASRVVPNVPISRRESEVLRPIPASRGAGRESHGPPDAFPVGTDCGTCLTGFTPAPGISRGPREPRVAEASLACAPPLTSIPLLNLTWARGRHPGQVSLSFQIPGLIQPNTLCTYDEPSLCR